MNNFKMAGWPFDENEIVTLHWITSPERVNKTARIKVFFKVDRTDDLIPVEMAWGMLPELRIGSKFKGGKPLGMVPEKANYEIVASKVENQMILDAARCIPTTLFNLHKNYQLCSEKCVLFMYQKKQFVIPCMELVRAIYAHNTQLANQIISTGGIENLINTASWIVNGKTVSFDFLNYSVGTNKALAQSIAILYGVEEFKNGFDSVYTNYTSNRKIAAEIPAVQKLRLDCCGIENERTVFLTTIKRVNTPCPFDEILYGPETIKKETIKLPVYVPDPKTPEKPEIASADVSAKQGRASQIEIEGRGFETYYPVCVSRKKQEKTGTGNSTRRIGVPGPDTVSVNEQVGRGELPFASLTPSCEYEPEGEKLVFPDKEHFKCFQNALMILNKYHGFQVKSLSYDSLPSGKSISTLSNGDGREYACAEISTDKNRWIIIELDLSDGLSISTVFIRNSENKKELVQRLLNKLMDANGHWAKSCFAGIDRYERLDHYNNRTPERWAELMYQKML